MSTHAGEASSGSGGPGPRVVSCPACGASITLRALGQSVMAACPACRTQIDVSQPAIQIIRKYQEQAQHLHVPLGARGLLRGQRFEVVGAMGRASQGYRWEEYLLFNPYQGFRWLVYDAGHWNLGQMVKDTSHIRVDYGASYDSHRFRTFQQSNVVVEWVVGEFYWRVAVGDRVAATDYVAPPLMLSCEKADGEITWTLLDYLQPAEVEQAFGVKSRAQRFIAANQPNPAAAALQTVQPVLVLALVLAILIQIASAIRAHTTEMFLGTYSFAHPPGTEEQVFGPLSLPAGHSLNEIEARAPLYNSWVELDCSLVNTTSGASFEFTNAFEHYSGRDSDGNWSEGSNLGRVLLTKVPAGTYNLVVDGSGADATGQPLQQPVTLSLRHDVLPWRNFWLALIAILAYPVWLLVRRHTYERERWAESDGV